MSPTTKKYTISAMAKGASEGGSEGARDAESSLERLWMKLPMSLKLIKPTPTIILVSQSETVSMLVFVSKLALSFTFGLSLGTPNKKPMNAPVAMHIIAQRHAAA